MTTALAFSRSIEVFIKENLSPEALSANLAKVAHKVVDDLVGTGQVPAAYTSYVDGRKGAAWETVRPDGAIYVKFNPFPAVATYALEFLKARAPEKTGRYRRGFYFGITREGGSDGKFVEADAFNPAAITSDVVEVVIGNTEPYSRKVDVQYVGLRKLNFGEKCPPGLFEDAAKMINARFGGMVVAKRVYTTEFPGQYTLQREQFRKSGRAAGKALGRKDKRVESPALVIALPGAFIGARVSGAVASVARVSARAAAWRRRVGPKPGRETRASSSRDIRRWNETTKTFDYLRFDPATGKHHRVG